MTVCERYLFPDQCKAMGCDWCYGECRDGCLSTGWIVGVVFLVIFVICLIPGLICLCLYCVTRSRDKKKLEARAQQLAASPAGAPNIQVVEPQAAQPYTLQPQPYSQPYSQPASQQQHRPSMFTPGTPATPGAGALVLSAQPPS